MQKAILFLLVVFLAACNNEAEQVETPDSTATAESLLLPEDLLSWHIDYDSASGEAVLKQQPALVPADSLTAPALVEGLNAAWKEIPLAYQRTQGDTVFVGISNSEYLTQRMGSSGPQGYLALVTYTLTELKGIRFVKFDFKAGDHAMPGTFNRESFKDFLPKK